MMCAGGSELCASSREGNARLVVRSELLAHAPTNERLGGGVVLLVALLASGPRSLWPEEPLAPDWSPAAAAQAH